MPETTSEPVLLSSGSDLSRWQRIYQEGVSPEIADGTETYAQFLNRRLRSEITEPSPVVVVHPTTYENLLSTAAEEARQLQAAYSSLHSLGDPIPTPVGSEKGINPRERKSRKQVCWTHFKEYKLKAMYDKSQPYWACGEGCEKEI